MSNKPIACLELIKRRTEFYGIENIVIKGSIRNLNIAFSPDFDFLKNNSNKSLSNPIVTVHSD